MRLCPGGLDGPAGGPGPGPGPGPMQRYMVSLLCIYTYMKVYIHVYICVATRLNFFVFDPHEMSQGNEHRSCVTLLCVVNCFCYCWVLDSESDFSGLSGQIPWKSCFYLICLGREGSEWIDMASAIIFGF